MELSDDQEAALCAVEEWYREAVTLAAPQFCDDTDHFPYAHTHGTGPAPVMSVGGRAGSGKTTVIRLLEDRLGTCRIAYGTPTHRAAHILRHKLDEEQGTRVRTMHSLTYFAQPVYHCEQSALPVRESPRACACGADDAKRCECPAAFEPCSRHANEALATGSVPCRVKHSLTFERRRYLGGWRDLVVIDESSMLTKQQVEDVRAFGVPVLLVGDHGQLPPVKADMNPWMAAPDRVLTVNHRQDDASGIVALAYAYRDGRAPQLGAYGDGSSVVMDLNHPEALKLLDAARFPPGPDRQVICWTNRQRALVNRLFHGGGPLREGDRLVSLSNAEPDVVLLTAQGTAVPTGACVFAANGMTGTVLKVLELTPKVAHVVVALDDADDGDGRQDEGGRRGILVQLAAEQLGAEAQLAYNAKPRGTTLWDYAYAITAHKAQGGEYDDVIVIDQSPQDYARWMYTAVTRAKKRLVVIRWRT